MSKEIEIVISPDGEEVAIDLIGFHGQGCAEITAKIAEALGEVKKSDNKCEFWEQEVVSQQHVQQ